MTMRRKGSFIVALLAMMVMLSACGWLDQLWILAKTSRALDDDGIRDRRHHD